MLSQNLCYRHRLIPDAICLNTASGRLVHKTCDTNADRSQPAVTCPTLLQEFLGGLAQLVQIGLRCDRSISLTAFLCSNLPAQIRDRHGRIFRFDRHSTNIRRFIVNIQKHLLTSCPTAFHIDSGLHKNSFCKKIGTYLRYCRWSQPKRICQILSGCRAVVVYKF